MAQTEPLLAATVGTAELLQQQRRQQRRSHLAAAFHAATEAAVSASTPQYFRPMHSSPAWQLRARNAPALPYRCSNCREPVRAWQEWQCVGVLYASGVSVHPSYRGFLLYFNAPLPAPAAVNYWVVRCPSCQWYHECDLDEESGPEYDPTQPQLAPNPRRQ